MNDKRKGLNNRKRRIYNSIKQTIYIVKKSIWLVVKVTWKTVAEGKGSLVLKPRLTYVHVCYSSEEKESWA